MLTFELLFLLPFLLLMFLSLVEFSALLVGEAKVSAAAREGARVAAMGGDAADVQTTVATVLGPGLTAKIDLSTAVTITYPAGMTTGNPVQVQVCVKGNLLAPNFLCVIGFDLSTKDVCFQTTMMIE
jgi:Flp pilus assembly protein TadG